MNLNKNVSTRAGIAIIALLSLALIGLILYSWNWAGNYLVEIVSDVQ